MSAWPGWPEALDRAAAASLTLVIGDTDTGKTSLASFLARGLEARGLAVGLVDTDLGQSEIGPPTTIGLGRLRRPGGALGEAELLGLHWVGSTSPPGFEPSVVGGTCRLVERARSLGLSRVVVDTCGLVRGEPGRALKQRKIEAVDPDLVICLEREGECGPIVAPYAGRGRPAILRLPASPAARQRSSEERRRHREAALERYFAGSGTCVVDLGRLAAGGDDLEGALAGLCDAHGETLGLARIVSVDLAQRRVLLQTPVPAARIARIAPGPEGFRPVESAR